MTYINEKCFNFYPNNFKFYDVKKNDKYLYVTTDL